MAHACKMIQHGNCLTRRISGKDSFQLNLLGNSLFSLVFVAIIYFQWFLYELNLLSNSPLSSLLSLVFVAILFSMILLLAGFYETYFSPIYPVVIQCSVKVLVTPIGTIHPDLIVCFKNRLIDKYFLLNIFSNDFSVLYQFYSIRLSLHK